MDEVQLRGVDRVRIEITNADGTFEIELHGPLAIASLGIEIDTVDVPGNGIWRNIQPTDGAEITLKAHGKLVKAERREQAPPKPRRPPGGRPPMPGMDANCTRCGQPRREHGGPKQMGACPGETGLRAKRFAVAPQAGHEALMRIRGDAARP